VLSSGDTPARVETDLAAAIEAGTTTRPAVMVRTRSQLTKVVRSNPFLERGEDEGHLHVVFLPGRARDALRPLDLEAHAPEEAVASATELYLLLPDGVGRSKLAADLARTTGSVGTMRNWRTVTSLLAMADDAAR
jgi:uncharacterized protein (DUF1697 family)